MVTPLLAVTWVIGALAINEHTSAFVWMFAILSSIQVLNACQYCVRIIVHLQGVCLLIFYVLRNEKVLT